MKGVLNLLVLLCCCFWGFFSRQEEKRMGNFIWVGNMSFQYLGSSGEIKLPSSFPFAVCLYYQNFILIDVLTHFVSTFCSLQKVKTIIKPVMILILFCCLVKVNSGAFLFTAFTLFTLFTLVICVKHVLTLSLPRV